MCPAPRSIEVAAIKREQCARRFEDRIRLIRQCLTAGVRIPNSLSSQEQLFQYRTEGQGRKIAQGHHYYQAGSE
jgi:hypothetical protein